MSTGSYFLYTYFAQEKKGIAIKFLTKFISHICRIISIALYIRIVYKLNLIPSNVVLYFDNK